MLSERCYALLTAYVDGELSARQRKLVRRLLHRSAEARTLLQQLGHDAEALRRLPRPRLGPDFPGRVVRSVHERGLSQRRLVGRAPAQPLPAWAGIALAASVLLLVGLGSYFYFSRTLPDRPGGPVAVRPAPEAPAEPVEPEAPPDNGAGGRAREDRPHAEDPKRPDIPPPVQVAEVPKGKPAPAKGPAAVETAPETALTLPVPEKEMFQPQAVQANLPVIFQFGDLNVPRLREELRKDSGFRLEVPCRESNRAFERLQAAFKAHGVGVLVDQVAQARLKHKLQTNFVLYAEDLLPEQLAGILQKAAAEDRKAQPPHPQFDGLVVTRLSRDDRKELSTLGVDPRPVPPGRPADPKKPVSEGTAGQVTQALAGQGGTARAEPNKAKPPEHLAVVLAYNPVRPRPGSAEVRRFLDSRKPPRSGTVQVLLVLRETKR